VKGGFLSSLDQRIRELSQWIALLGPGPASTPLAAPSSLREGVPFLVFLRVRRMFTGTPNEEKEAHQRMEGGAVEFFRRIARGSSSLTDFFLGDIRTKGPTSAVVKWQRSSESAHAREKDVERFAQLSPEEQRRILVAVLEAKRGQLQGLLTQAAPLLEKTFLKQRSSWDQQFGEDQRRLEDLLKSLRRRIRSVDPRVPPGAKFIGLASPLGSAEFLDDWAILRREVESHPEWGIILRKEELRPGEDWQEKIQAILAREYGVPGQHTVGIALGVLEEGEVQDVRDLWPQGSIATDHPWLGLSFVYTPRQTVDSFRRWKRSIVSFSTAFSVWANQPLPGLIVDQPDPEEGPAALRVDGDQWFLLKKLVVQAPSGLEEAQERIHRGWEVPAALPGAVRRRFEEEVRSRAGLEQEA